MAFTRTKTVTISWLLPSKKNWFSARLCTLGINTAKTTQTLTRRLKFWKPVSPKAACKLPSMKRLSAACRCPAQGEEIMKKNQVIQIYRTQRYIIPLTAHNAEIITASANDCRRE